MMDNKVLSILNSGSRFDSDLELTSSSSLPVSFNRKNGRQMIAFDLSGMLLQLNKNGSIMHRWLLSDDLKYPTPFNISKDGLYSILSKGVFFDAELKLIFKNGIQVLETVYSPPDKSDLSNSQIDEIIEKYVVADEVDKIQIEIFLSSRSVFIIPKLNEYNKKYQEYSMNNTTDRRIIINEGWLKANTVYKKQIIGRA